jgi:hypothetical protein
VLKRVRAEDPRKLLIQRTTTVLRRVPLMAFGAAFGTPNMSTSGGGLHCGNGAHLISGIMHSSWSIVPDFEHCNYAIYFRASRAMVPARIGFEHETRRRCPGAGHEDGGGRSDVQLRLRQGD